jgi:hypothetical protein
MNDRKEREQVMRANHVAKGRRSATEKDLPAEGVYTQAIRVIMASARAGGNASE